MPITITRRCKRAWLRLPASMPYLFTALKIAATAAVVVERAKRDRAGALVFTPPKHAADTRDWSQRRNWP